MYTRVDDFVTDYREEAREAAKNWDVLTDAALAVSPAPGCWTIGEHLWHLASLWQYVFVSDLGLWPPEALVEPAPATAAGLARFYAAAAAQACDWVAANWTDADLVVEIELWGMRMTRGKLLWEAVKHEAHHRGQIIALMRLAGLPVHGIYGPSREEAQALEASAGEALI